MPDVILIDREGQEIQVADTEAAQLLGRPDGRWRVRTDADAASRVSKEALDERYGDTAGKVKAGAAAIARGATLGLSDVALGALGGGEDLRHLREANPTISAVGEIGGAIATAIPSGGSSLAARLPAGIVARAGTNIARAGEGASVAGRLGAAALGGAVEGSLYGAGQAVSELALDDQPLTVERIGSTLSSRMLVGGVIGAGANVVAKGLEVGIGRAKHAIDEHLAARVRPPTGASDDVADLALLDAKGLRAAREAELGAIKTAHKAETEALEAARVTERQSIADDLAALRRDIKDQQHFLTTKGVQLPAVEGKASAAELGRMAAKAERQLAGMLDNPIGLAKNPTRALDALQRQEHAMVQLLERGDDLRAVFAKDATAVRRTALDSVPGALEKNRALQARIAKVNEPLPAMPASSPRLEAIDAAKDALAGGTGGATTLAEQLVQGAAFGTITGAVAGTDLPGAAAIAPLIGAKASKLITDRVFGGIAKAKGAAIDRTTRAVSSALDVAGKVARKASPHAARAAVPLATSTLDGTRFAPEPADRKPGRAPAKTKGNTLAAAYKERSSELLSQVSFDVTGRAEVLPHVRSAIAEHLKPIAVHAPMLADRLETMTARKLEFLAERLPKRPDVFANTAAPDLWQPSELEMRRWARLVAGVEDPHSILDRVADGSVSPEDRDVMREVYPEMLADFTRQVFEQLPTLRGRLPYHRRLALSRLTGVPADASMDPRILRVLQASFAAETGTDGGIHAPMPQPQFGALGSLPKHDASRAQRRERE